MPKIKLKKLTRNFNINEFACKDGSPVPDRYEKNVLELAKNLQVLRDDLNANPPAGVPTAVEIMIHVNSGYRPPAYNRKIGGAPLSKHLTAEAGDISSKYVTPKQIAARIEKLIKAGKMKQGGLGLYKSWVHYDIRGTKARW